MPAAAGEACGTAMLVSRSAGGAPAGAANWAAAMEAKQIPASVSAIEVSLISRHFLPQELKRSATSSFHFPTG
jgi:hypothetical protein